MISSSVRRVARPPTVAPTLQLQPRTVALAAAASQGNATGFQSFHHRRYSSSSSKPPVPPSDGSKGGFDASAAHAKGGVAASDKREGKSGAAGGGKRRGKDGGNNGVNGNGKAKSKQQEGLLNLPSVPSTQHLHPHDIYVASFFSTHRPISITTSVPPSSTEASFSSIFSSKKQQSASKQSDVIYTLSSAVNAMEKGLSKDQLPSSSTSSAEDIDLRAAVTQASASNAESSDVTHLDGVPVQDLRASIQDFAKKLRPFNPPPPPVPMDNASTAFESKTSSENLESKKDQSYSTVLTIRESNHADGSKTYEAYTTPFVRVEDMEAPAASQQQQQEGVPRTISEPPTRFLHRMGIRQLRWEEFRDRRRTERMHAISVKRQRKLKMKKHKFRKLMRKTRHQRRKLDKA